MVSNGPMNVRETLKEWGIKPSKRLGQSFLVDEKIANRIVEACEIKQEDTILEVGPGLGVLTYFLCDRGAKVFAVEKDKALFEFLTQKFQDAKNLTLLNQDILSLKLSTLKRWIGASSAPTNYLRSNKLEPRNQFKIVSNLPYSISSDFLYSLLDNRSYIQLCVLTLQKEVAQRLYAKPGNKIYGALSVFFQFYMEVKPLFLISGNSFFPRSPVVSQVILITPRTKVQEVNEKLFFKVVRSAFQERRKQLKNSLKLKADVIGGIDLTRRPESLGYEEFIRLIHGLENAKMY